MNAPHDETLLRIADSARHRVEALKLATPGFRLRERLGSARPAGRLERALRRGAPAGPLRLLCELARAMPARGVLQADPDPAAFARLCEAGGAAAISIVTEPDHYGGNPAWAESARRATGLPILLDDFVVDPYQLLEAAVHGADGVRLIAALFSDVQLQVMVSEARMRGLDALVEVHDRAELQRALKAGATLVGIGDDALRHAGARAGGTADLLAAVPPLVTAVAGIRLERPGDLAALRGTRCDAVLAGEVLAASSDPAAALAALQTAARG